MFQEQKRKNEKEKKKGGKRKGGGEEKNFFFPHSGVPMTHRRWWTCSPSCPDVPPNRSCVGQSCRALTLVYLKIDHDHVRYVTHGYDRHALNKFSF